MWRLSLGLVTAAFLGWVSASASATVMLRMSVEELTQTGAGVVRGRVVSAEAREGGPNGLTGIYTYARVEVDAWWAGSGPRSVEVVVHGGRVGNRAMAVPGQASFEAGEEVVVFLMRGGEAYWPNGMSQGKWLVTRGADGRETVTSTVDLGSVVERDARGGIVASDLPRERTSLEALRSRVSAAWSAR